MSLDTEEYTAFLETIRSAYGFDFTDYSMTSLKRRFEYFMTGRHFKDLAQLRFALLKDEGLFEEFIQTISVTVTEMFRDPSFYIGLREKVVKRLASYPLIRIWVAGCATGQEVYSIAILLKENNLLERSLIYGTDINQRSLQIARDGVYPIENMKNYAGGYERAGGKGRFGNYYTEKFNMAMLDREIRKHTVFSVHNLVTDKSFNEFQLILCRNVLIYFNQDLQEQTINLFHESLCSFGMLGLGSKETLNFTSKKNDFREIVPREKIYMRTR